MSLDKPIAEFNKRMIQDSWHCVTRSPTESNLLKIIDKIGSWPSKFAKDSFKRAIESKSWHEMGATGTMSNLNKVAEEWKAENQ